MQDELPQSPSEQQLVVELLEARADIAAGRIHPVEVALARLELAFNAGWELRRVADGMAVK